MSKNSLTVKLNLYRNVIPEPTRILDPVLLGDSSYKETFYCVSYFLFFLLKQSVVFGFSFINVFIVLIVSLSP